MMRKLLKKLGSLLLMLLLMCSPVLFCVGAWELGGMVERPNIVTCDSYEHLVLGQQCDPTFVY